MLNKIELKMNITVQILNSLKSRFASFWSL